MMSGVGPPHDGCVVQPQVVVMMRQRRLMCRDGCRAEELTRFPGDPVPASSCARIETGFEFSGSSVCSPW
jgi:hypothetical protein